MRDEVNVRWSVGQQEGHSSLCPCERRGRSIAKCESTPVDVTHYNAVSHFAPVAHFITKDGKHETETGQ